MRRYNRREVNVSHRPLVFRNLFAHGENGGIYSANDPRYNYLTATANTPVSTVGDNIGNQLPLVVGNRRGINLLTFTESFENAIWVKDTGVTVTAETGSFTYNGERFTWSTVDVTGGSNFTGVTQSTTITSATDTVTRCSSVFVKAGTLTSITVDIQFFGGSFINNSATVNLSTGAVTGTGVGVEDCGGGIYRVYSTLANNGTGNTGCSTKVRRITTGGTFQVSGAQQEIASTPTAYEANPAGSINPPSSTSDAGRGIVNLLTFSEQFDNAAWTKTRATITANAAVSPANTVTADKLVEDATAGNNHYAYNLMTIVATTIYTWSVYAKAGERTWLGLSAYDGNTHLTFFDLTNGVVGTNGSGNTAAIAAVGNGWYRCSITRTTAATTTGAIECYLASADNVISYNGNGTSGLFLTGAQVNLGTLADYQYTSARLGGPGLNLYQTSSSARPFWGRRPNVPGGRGVRNQLVKSNDPSNAAWGLKTNVTLTPGVSDPFGGTTAFTMSRTSPASSAVVGQFFTGSTATNYVGSWYVRRNTGAGTVDLVVGDNVNQTIAVTSSWQRLSATDNTSSTTVRNYISLTGANTDTIDICYSQLEFGTTPSALQVVDAVNDITEAGYPSIASTYFGGDDYFTMGTQSFGSASLNCVAGQAWSVGGAFRVIGNAGNACLLAKCGATLANKTLQVSITTGGFFIVNARGTEASYGSGSMNDGLFHSWSLIWDGTTLNLRVDGGAAIPIAVGTAVEEAQNITIGARTESSIGSILTGWEDFTIIEDRALTAAEQNQFFSYCRNNLGSL